MSIVIVVIIRSFIAFFALLFFIRLIGKQQMTQLTFFDYINGITIGSIASTISVQVNQNTFATLAGLVVWSLLPILLGFLSMHSVWIRKVVEGESSVVIENGKILDKHLRRLRVNTDDLLTLMRAQGVFNVADVEFAIMETSGDLSILKKSQKQPVTPSDLNLPTEYAGLPTNLIQDGVILTDALLSLSLSKAWLMGQLRKQSINNVEQISLAQLDTVGNLYVDLKGEKPYYIIDTKM